MSEWKIVVESWEHLSTSAMSLLFISFITVELPSVLSDWWFLLTLNGYNLANHSHGKWIQPALTAVSEKQTRLWESTLPWLWQEPRWSAQINHWWFSGPMAINRRDKARYWPPPCTLCVFVCAFVKFISSEGLQDNFRLWECIQVTALHKWYFELTTILSVCFNFWGCKINKHSK